MHLLLGLIILAIGFLGGGVGYGVANLRVEIGVSQSAPRMVLQAVCETVTALAVALWYLDKWKPPLAGTGRGRQPNVILGYGKAKGF